MTFSPYFKSLEHQERGPNDYHVINGADSVSKPTINEKSYTQP